MRAEDKFVKLVELLAIERIASTGRPPGLLPPTVWEAMCVDPMCITLEAAKADEGIYALAQEFIEYSLRPGEAGPEPAWLEWGRDPWTIEKG